MSRRASARTRPGAVAALLGSILCAASGASATEAAGHSSPPEDIRDIRGPQFVAPAWLLPALVAGGAVLALGVYGVWRWQRHRRSLRTTLPFELALQRLEDLRALMQPQSAREFSIAVSDIVRSYIEQRFDLTATHRTTEEFLRDLLEFPHAALAQPSRVAVGISASVRSRQIRGHGAHRAEHGIAAPECVRFRARNGKPQSTAETEQTRMTRFLQPEWLWLLTLLPVVIFWRGRRGPIAAIEYSDVGLVREVARSSRSRIGRWVWLPSLVAAGLMIVGLARPQRMHSRTEVTVNGIDIVLGLDVSGSMQALDFTIDHRRVNRIEVVKSVVSKFIEERPNDRIGLIAFAGVPFLVSPITLDHDWLQQNLERISIGSGDDGTAIGSAIAASVNRLRMTAAKSKVVILLTDGVNNTGKIAPAGRGRSGQGPGRQGIYHRRGRARQGTDSGQG